MKYREIISQMTLEEKALMMSGKNFWETVDIPRLNIPSVFLADGPHGIRRQAGQSDHLGMNPSVPATCFPTASGMANTWNPELAEAVGQYLGKEAKIQGVSVVLGPGLNIKRSPLCGRNFEYYSEDPYLSGKMAAGMIRGIQSQGIAACPKHFAANSQELRRMCNDAVIDERTLREIYTTGFEIAVKEGKAKAIMSAYNKVNGVYANENRHLLREILVDEWGFKGIVVSDWGGSNDHVEGIKAGSHLEMPTTGCDGKRLILDALKDGTLSEAELNERVDELLQVIFEVAPAENDKEEFDQDLHHAKARQAAEECIVLLKNEDHILPFHKRQKVALIGDFAETPRYQGAGSSQVNPTRVDNTLDLFKRNDYAFVGYEQGFRRNGEEDKLLRERAVALAKKAEVVLLYLGLNEVEEAEGEDRTHMKLADNQVRLLEAISEVNNNVVVVLSTGVSLEMPWIDRVKGLVHGHLPGQAGSQAILNIIYGIVCPSGRLAETYPLTVEDTPCFSYYPGLEKTSEYREGIFVGYRYYETADIPVRFPFGYGLSYTTFSYDSLEVTGDRAIVSLTNTGAVMGAEVVQMYVSKRSSKTFRAVRELKGFTKVYLQPGDSIKVEIPFDDKTFRYYNTHTNSWEIEEGEYEIQIGKNVREIVLKQSISIAGSGAEIADQREALLPYYNCDIKNVPHQYFEALLGHPVPDGKWDTSKPLELNDAVNQMFYARSRLARLALKIIVNLRERSIARGKPDLNLNFIYGIPFRGIAKMTGGAVSMEMAKALLEMVNGHSVKGLIHLLKGAVRNRR
ncbi:glycoside hydrolase family 3 C-terminal domain-containing protein [Enterocloster aldenensis]|uniref:glycoside hydrolase family 3 C-terminal domain-containing protein n=1 Tax=Enterocloster aldenensis TaxID=358742 RepID=UPI004028C3C5